MMFNLVDHKPLVCGHQGQKYGAFFTTKGAINGAHTLKFVFALFSEHIDQLGGSAINTADDWDPPYAAFNHALNIFPRTRLDDESKQD